MNTGHGVQNHNASIQHPQAALHFGGEVHVTRGVDDVHHVVLPVGGGGGGGDGDTPFPFLGHPVHCSGPFVHPSHLSDAARQKQYTLGDGGFPCVYVGDKANIPNFGDLISCWSGYHNVGGARG